MIEKIKEKIENEIEVRGFGETGFGDDDAILINFKRCEGDEDEIQQAAEELGYEAEALWESDGLTWVGDWYINR